MATYTTLPGDLAFNPQIAAEYMQLQFVEQLQLIQEKLGIIVPFPADLMNGGDRVEVPWWTSIADLISRRDLTSESTGTDLKITASNASAIILRRKAGPVKYSRDVYTKGRSPEEVSAELGRQMGYRAAEEIRTRILQMCVACMDAMDSPSADAHIHNVYSASTKVNMSYALIAAAKAKLKDNQERLTTLVMHSDAFYDLKADARTNFPALTGHTERVLAGQLYEMTADGMRLLVVDDSNLKADPGSGSGTYAKYRSFVLGPKAIWLGYPQEMNVWSERRLYDEAPFDKVLGNFDFAPHLRGFDFQYGTIGGNPTNTNFGTAAYWEEAFNDHREVLCAEIVHNSSLG